MLKRLGQFIFLILVILGSYKAYHVYRDVNRVLTYRSIVADALADNDTTANVDTVLAMIYTETKGASDDIMQSSESSTGVANTISDSKTSIQQGIAVLSENLNLAKKEQVDQWTAVQAYNFGSAYIDFVAKHGHQTSIELATSYSRDIVAPSLGNTSGKTYFYYHPIAFFYGGGKLYVNGGNIYYAREVQFNLQLIKLVRLIKGDFE